MQITVNGEARVVTEGQSVASLLAELGIQAERVAVELNGKIVDRRAFTDTSLSDGDRVEVIGFIGGGGGGRSDDDAERSADNCRDCIPLPPVGGDREV